MNTDFKDNGKADNVNIFEINNLDNDIQELIHAAVEARKKAYIPYSRFAVGAALRTTTNKIITGCNIENAAYSPSLCAERVAIGKAVSEGHRTFSAVAIVAQQEKAFTSPCGVCRQTLIEFAHEDIPVYLAKPQVARILVTSVHKLLPGGFGPNSLEEYLNLKD